MNLLQKLEAQAAERKAMLPAGLHAFGIPIEEVYSPTEARIGTNACYSWAPTTTWV